MSDPKGFLKFEREEIPRRPVDERLRDWNEVDEVPGDALLLKQSHRCMDCGVAFCQGDTGCPVNNLIPEWNDLISRGKWQDAAVRLLSTNNFPEFTGRLCPAPCESACVLGINSEPVNIKAAEWGIIDKAFASGWVRAEKAKLSSGRAVAVIGSGPAGLTVAQQLARSGHSVCVFEKAATVGGLLRYGIPDFKMQKDLIDRRVSQLVEEGVTFRTSTAFGVDVVFSDLQSEFDAIVLATGAEAPRDLQVPGRELRGIYPAMDYLVEQNRFGAGEISELTMSALNKRVVILGGGDTGSDCLGTALRQGASQVLQFEIQARPPLVRDARTPWPNWPMKLKSSHAHEEGGLREWSLQTVEFVDGAGAVSGSVTEAEPKVRPVPAREPDHVTALRARRLDTGEEILFEADMVVLALGFTGADRRIADFIPGLELTPKGTILTDAEFMTTVPGVFACGDNRRGASLIVWAIAEGRRLALEVNRFLGSVESRLMARPEVSK